MQDPPACGHALAPTNPCPTYGLNSTAALWLYYIGYIITKAREKHLEKKQMEEIGA